MCIYYRNIKFRIQSNVYIRTYIRIIFTCRPMAPSNRKQGARRGLAAEALGEWECNGRIA